MTIKINKDTPIPGLVYVQEGQFVGDYLNGFGRVVIIKVNGDCANFSGTYVDGKLNGYGEFRYSSGRITRALFENGAVKEKKEEIKSYNPYVHLVAKRIDIDKYTDMS